LRNNRQFALGFLAILALGILPSRIRAADAKTGTQVYLDYRAALQKATKLEEILPFMSAEYRQMLESQPKKDAALWLGRLREGTPVKDLKITKETAEGNKCTVEGTGTSARGNAIHGKIHLVKEGGAWKIDEEAWAT
jgi:hypothetical protein